MPNAPSLSGQNHSVDQFDGTFINYEASGKSSRGFTLFHRQTVTTTPRYRIKLISTQLFQSRGSSRGRNLTQKEIQAIADERKRKAEAKAKKIVRVEVLNL